MPIYEYQCTACDERLEAEQRFHDAPLTTCPKCGGELRKVFSPVGVVFKGSGFYKTDSRASTSATKTLAKASTDGSSESSTKSDTAAASSDAPTTKKDAPAAAASAND
jgi:putative FmdB family regulatory protein